MRERALGAQAGLTSVANEVVVLMMVGGAGSTTARGLRRRRGRIHGGSWPEAAGRLVVVVGDDVDGSASTVFRLAKRTSARQ
jgi:hypothetical protein